LGSDFRLRPRGRERGSPLPCDPARDTVGGSDWRGERAQRASSAELRPSARHRGGTVPDASSSGASEASRSAILWRSSCPATPSSGRLRYRVTIDDHPAVRDWIARTTAAISWEGRMKRAFAFSCPPAIACCLYNLSPFRSEISSFRIVSHRFAYSHTRLAALSTGRSLRGVRLRGIVGRELRWRDVTRPIW
jgi:hypothetical protein